MLNDPAISIKMTLEHQKAQVVSYVQNALLGESLNYAIDRACRQAVAEVNIEDTVLRVAKDEVAKQLTSAVQRAIRETQSDPEIRDAIREKLMDFFGNAVKQEMGEGDYWGRNASGVTVSVAKKGEKGAE